MTRLVSLVLVNNDGELLGELAPFEVSSPYWQEVGEVVAEAQNQFGIDVDILRLLSAKRATPHGGAVTYLAQAVASLVNAPLIHVDDIDLAPQLNRTDYAKPGGPRQSLHWAERASGVGPFSDAQQLRTWNLSAIWRLQTESEVVWLKEVPQFLVHESAILQWLKRSAFNTLVPSLLATDGTRMLLEDVPGTDLYGAEVHVRSVIDSKLHPLQAHTSKHVGDLLDIGVPDGRSERLVELITDVVDRFGTAPNLCAFVERLPEYLAKVDACGLPDTLVHGDLHPGNVRRSETNYVLMDWGDSFVGNPAFDIIRLSEDLETVDAEQLIAAWAERWRQFSPECDPAAALELLRPVAALRPAAIYAGFLDRIEPSEYPYHSSDAGIWLQKAAELVRT